MLKIRAKVRLGAAAAAMLLAVVVAGCAKSSFRNVLAVGDDTHVEIDDPRGFDTWSVLTSSETDVVLLHLTGMGVDVGALKIRVLLDAGMVVAQLSPPRGQEVSIALSGRPATWTLQFGLREGEAAPVRYRMVVERPSTATGGPRCEDALRAKGINAWVLSIPGPPGTGTLVFPTFGSIALSSVKPAALTAAAPPGGELPVLRVSGGTTLKADLADLGCEPGQVQLNFWDTGKGKPPTLTVSDTGGHPLCGDAGQPACLADPATGRWVSWTFSANAPIGSLSLDCDELYISSIVIQ
ncbi:MAG TPA: hypothetical protein VMS64_09280 [Candidatus Methylomirabilis sp.]|nr:hypothetical protein [Candidatus Methylomirabilis sp.]